MPKFGGQTFLSAWFRMIHVVGEARMPSRPSTESRLGRPTRSPCLSPWLGRC